jgi:hypothetical protein
MILLGDPRRTCSRREERCWPSPFFLCACGAVTGSAYPPSGARLPQGSLAIASSPIAHRASPADQTGGPGSSHGYCVLYESCGDRCIRSRARDHAEPGRIRSRLPNGRSSIRRFREEEQKNYEKGVDTPDVVVNLPRPAVNLRRWYQSSWRGKVTIRYLFTDRRGAAARLNPSKGDSDDCAPSLKSDE